MKPNASKAPFFSFLMCVNRLDGYLRDCIESVLRQTDSEFLFYIIANNCNDDLWNFLKTYNDGRIRIFRTKIGQLSFNLNVGLDAIESEYIIRIDADDVCLDDRLLKTMRALEKFDYPDVLTGSANIIDDSGAVVGHAEPPSLHRDWRKNIWWRNPAIHPATAMKRSSIIAKRGYLGGYSSEDFDLWLRCARDPNFRLVAVADTMIKYRTHDNQTSRKPEPYAESASHLMREFVMRSNPLFLIGAILCLAKHYKARLIKR